MVLSAVVVHYGHIIITATTLTKRSRVEVLVEDRGGGFDPDALQPLPPVESSGRLQFESGLGVPNDIDRLKQQTGTLEQHTIDLRLQLEERDDDLAAARAANRELMTQLNAPRTTP